MERLVINMEQRVINMEQNRSQTQVSLGVARPILRYSMSIYEGGLALRPFGGRRDGPLLTDANSFA